MLGFDLVRIWYGSMISDLREVEKPTQTKVTGHIFRSKSGYRVMRGGNLKKKTKGRNEHD